MLILLGVLLLVAVALPRFGAYSEPSNPNLEPYITAQGDDLPAVSIDMREYLKAVEHYQGDRAAPELAPFNRRLGVTLLAGQLP